jgi:hypothetical protein
LIKDLNEINRILSVFDQYDLTSIEKEKLLRILRNSPVISQVLSDHESTLIFCENGNLLYDTNGKIFLTKQGHKMIKMLKKDNPANVLDLSDIQRDFVNKEIFLNTNSPIADTIKEYFVADDEKETWIYDYYENPPLPSEFIDRLGLLIQSHLIIEQPGVLIINKKYAQQVSTLFAQTTMFSKDALSQMLEQQTQIGELAEEKALQYEKNDLLQAGCVEESELVKRISTWNVAEGYDIKSFHGHSKNKRYDKFIEVKGSSGSEFRFYWSENEIRKARELRDRYWIYFIPNVFTASSEDLLKIRDPAKLILKSSKYVKNCIAYEISLRRSRKKLR